MRYNGDNTASNYRYYRGIPEGGGAGFQFSNSTGPRIGDNNSLRGVTLVYVFHYLSTTLRKTSLTESMSNGSNPPVLANSRVSEYVTMWNNTSAVSSISFANEAARNHGTDSVFSLYGLVG